MKTRNAAYGNNSAAIGSQKRVSDSEKRKKKKCISMVFQVVYGSTQLTNAAQFLGQLARLGTEQ